MINTIRQAINKRAHQLAMIDEKVYVLDMANDRSLNSIEEVMKWKPNNNRKAVKKNTKQASH